MDNTTNSRVRLWKERRPDTVVVVSGNKTFYTYIGNLPLIENGETVEEKIKRLQNENDDLHTKLQKQKEELKELKSVVRDFIDYYKKDKEDVGL